jgi:hypothetical protein
LEVAPSRILLWLEETFCPLSRATEYAAPLLQLTVMVDVALAEVVVPVGMLAKAMFDALTLHTLVIVKVTLSVPVAVEACASANEASNKKNSSAINFWRNSMRWSPQLITTQL